MRDALTERVSDRAHDGTVERSLGERLRRLARGTWFWTSGAVVTVGVTAACSLRTHVGRLLGEEHDGRGAHRIAGLWGRTIFGITPGWTMEVRGREHLLPDGEPSVIVANHESMTDIFLMYFLDTQFRWLAKESVFKMPVVGHAMRCCHYVPVRRGEKESHQQAIEASCERIRQGLSMFFFPEGTRSDTGEMRPFKLGAFRVAQREQVPVVPLVIKGARELLPKGEGVPKAAEVKIQVLPPLPAPRADEDLNAYAEKVRALIVSAHHEL